MTEAVESEAIVFVVDDDPSMRKALSNLFRSVGLRAEVFGSARELLESELPEVASCLVLDIRLPGPSGLDFQAELAKANIQIPIIFMTGHGDIPMTVKAMKAGAVDFLTKPFRDQDMLDAVAIAIERDRDKTQRRKDRCRAPGCFRNPDGPGAGRAGAGRVRAHEQADCSRDRPSRDYRQDSPGAHHAKNGCKIVGRSGQNGRNARGSPAQALTHQNLSMIFPCCVAAHCGEGRHALFSVGNI